MRMSAALVASEAPWCWADHSEEKPRTSPGSHRYRELPGERCPHGMLPRTNCPACCPRESKNKSGGHGRHSESRGDAMRAYWAKRRAECVTRAKGATK